MLKKIYWIKIILLPYNDCVDGITMKKNTKTHKNTLDYYKGDTINLVIWSSWVRLLQVANRNLKTKKNIYIYTHCIPTCLNY